VNSVPNDNDTSLPGASAASLLDVQTVANRLHCSTKHVYRLTDAGKMPAPIKLGSLTRWRQSEIDEWVKGGCRPPRFAAGNQINPA
jgi:excisionase family DNA binding protein